MAEPGQPGRRRGALGRWALAAALLAAAGCSERRSAAPPEPQPEPEPPSAVLETEVDGEPGPALVVPAGSGPWPLAPLLPDGLPPIDDWRRIVIEDEGGGQTLRLRAPGALARGEELRFVRRDGEVAIGLFLVAPPGATPAVKQAATRPSRLLLRPRRLAIATEVRPAAEPAPWPRLRVEVDGERRGRLERGRVAPEARVAEPGRPRRRESFPLSAVVAGYVPLAELTRVELVARQGGRRSFEAGALASSTLLLRPTKRGVWTLKVFDDEERTGVLRDVVTLALTTKAHAGRRRGPRGR